MGTQEESEGWRDENEERLRAFIESAPRKMWIARTDGTVEFFNREWRDYTGQGSAEGMLNWREAVHPADRPRLERCAAGRFPWASPMTFRSGCGGGATGCTAGTSGGFPPSICTAV